MSRVAVYQRKKYCLGKLSDGKFRPEEIRSYPYISKSLVTTDLLDKIDLIEYEEAVIGESEVYVIKNRLLSSSI